MRWIKLWQGWTKELFYCWLSLKTSHCQANSRRLKTLKWLGVHYRWFTNWSNIWRARVRGQWIVTDSFPRTNLIADRSLAVVTPRSALLSIDHAVRSLCDPLTYNYKFSWIQSTLGIALYVGGWPATSGFQLLRTLPVDLILSVCTGPRIMGLHFIALVSTCLWKRRWTSETIKAVIDD